MWLFGRKSDTLSGFYPNGRKVFQFWVGLGDGEVQSQEHSSGNVSWRVFVKKSVDNGGREKLQFQLKCFPKNENADANWSVVADNMIKLLHPDDREMNRVLVNTRTRFGSQTFSSVTIAVNDSLEEFKDKDNELCVQVEIGLKTLRNLKKCTNFTVRLDEDATFLVGDVKFHAELQRVRETSPVFITEWKDLPENAEIRIEDCTPESFNVFLKMIFDRSFHIELEDVGNLLDFGKKNEIALISEKCEKFLQKSVNDDAELIKLADKYGMQSVIIERMASIHSLPQLAKAFKHYRRFSDDTMRLLMKKFVSMS